MKSIRSQAALMAATLAAAGLGVVAGASSDQSRQVEVKKTSAVGKTETGRAELAQKLRSLTVNISTGRARFGSTDWNYPKPGHSVRQGQRMALKRRNRARNKAAHRG